MATIGFLFQGGSNAFLKRLIELRKLEGECRDYHARICKFTVSTRKEEASAEQPLFVRVFGCRLRDRRLSDPS